MKLSEFLEKSKEEQFFDSVNIVNIITTSPIILLTSALIDHCKNLLQRRSVICDTQNHTSAEIQAQLSTSFLGEPLIYAFMMGDEFLDPSLRSYLQVYTGCHLIVICTAREQAMTDRSGVIHIEAEEPLNYSSYSLLYEFLRKENFVDVRFPQELFKRMQTIDPDTACMMVYYQQLVGKNMKQFFEQWFDKILEPKYSFFLLSQHFFAKESQQFFHLLNKIAAEYSPEFWVSYWSEQLWQAYTFLSIMQTEGMQVAKKSVSKLPFSFTQKDWKKHSLEKLLGAHESLYQIDYANKNGSMIDALDMWYAKFLQR